MEKMVSNILGVVLALAIGTMLASAGSASSVSSNSTSLAGNASGNSTKSGNMTSAGSMMNKTAGNATKAVTNSDGQVMRQKQLT